MTHQLGSGQRLAARQRLAALAPPRPASGLEMLREFHAERTARLIERLTARRRAPGESDEATLCVGVAANFDDVTVTSHVSVRWPDGPPDDPPDDAGVLHYEAIWWDTEDVRIENPDDAEQYVIDRRVKRVRYLGPDGRQHEYDNRPIWAETES